MLTAGPIYKSEYFEWITPDEFTLGVISHFLIKEKCHLKKFLLQISTIFKNVDLFSKCLTFLLRCFAYYNTYLIIHPVDVNSWQYN